MGSGTEDFIHGVSALPWQDQEQNLNARPRPTELFTPAVINLVFVDISKKRKCFSESPVLSIAQLFTTDDLVDCHLFIFSYSLLNGRLASLAMEAVIHICVPSLGSICITCIE